MAENTVPATIATTAKRPGRFLIRRSMPSITLTAKPVWNNTSPMSTNKGMGVREKLATEPTQLRTICAMPASPPKISQAPITLMTKNENTTGKPKKSSTVDPPNNNQDANCQLMKILRGF